MDATARQQLVCYFGSRQMDHSVATLAQVAPGIAEALIATAIGLFAAIPAVIAYNKFASKVDRISIRYESFMEEFINIMDRKG